MADRALASSERRHIIEMAQKIKLPPIKENELLPAEHDDPQDPYEDDFESKEHSPVKINCDSTKHQQVKKQSGQSPSQ